MDITHLPRRVPARQSRSYRPLGTASLAAGCALIAAGCSIIGSKPSDTPRPPASVAVTAPVSLPAPPIVTIPAASVIAPAPEPELPQNLYDTRRSNSADVLDGYDEVVSHVLVFPDDSLKLGPDNKAIISDVLEAMAPETDILSVVGCSHGATSIADDNGNALLAPRQPPARTRRGPWRCSANAREPVPSARCGHVGRDWCLASRDVARPRGGRAVGCKRG